MAAQAEEPVGKWLDPSGCVMLRRLHRMRQVPQNPWSRQDTKE